MSSIGDIRNGWSDVLTRTYPGHNVYKYVTTGAVPPCWICRLVPGEVLTYGCGGITYNWDLIVLVPGDEDVAQPALDDYIEPTGEKSLYAMVYANQTLGLDDVTLGLPKLTQVAAEYRAGEASYFGATFTVPTIVTNL